MDEPAGNHELDLQHYVQVLGRRKKIVVLVTLAMVTAAVVVSWLQTPVYQAAAEVLLQARVSDSVFSSGGGSADPPRTVETEVRVIKSDAVRAVVRERLGTTPRVVASRLGETEVMKIQSRHPDARRAADVANAYAEAYVSYRRTQAVDDALAAGEAIQTRINSLQAEISDLDRAIAQGSAADRAAAETRSRPRYANLLSQQSLLQQKLDQVQVDASLRSGGAQLVVVADVPGAPVSPKPMRNAFAAMVVGLLTGAALAFLRDRLDDSIKTREDLGRVDPSIPVLGLIPVIPGPKRGIGNLTDSVSKAAIEAYRSLRTSVQLLGLDQPLRTIQVTSPMAGEGKTSTVANLGLALAAAGQRVVMVDCDLRRPRLHTVFGLTDTVGFTSAFLGDTPVGEAVQPVPGEERLFLLPSGRIPANPSEVLSSRRTAQLLSSLQEAFDIVLIDSPPLLPVTDATVLATQVEVTLLVAKARVTTRKQLLDALALLRRTGRSTIGTVLNQVSPGGGYGGEYQYEALHPDGSRRKRRSNAASATPSDGPTPLHVGPDLEATVDGRPAYTMAAAKRSQDASPGTAQDASDRVQQLGAEILVETVETPSNGAGNGRPRRPDPGAEEARAPGADAPREGEVDTLVVVEGDGRTDRGAGADKSARARQAAPRRRGKARHGHRRKGRRR